MKLLSSTTSPFSRRPRILIAEHGLDVEVAMINPWEDRKLLEGKNPMSRIPVLILDDGSSIVDSWVISTYLDTLAKEPLLPSEKLARVKMQSVCAICVEALNTSSMVVGTSLKIDKLSDKVCQWYFSKTKACLVDLNRRVGEGEFGQDDFNMIDMYAVCLLGFIEFRLKDELQWREDNLALASWFDKISTRPSVAETKPFLPS